MTACGHNRKFATGGLGPCSKAAIAPMDGAKSTLPATPSNASLARPLVGQSGDGQLRHEVGFPDHHGPHAGSSNPVMPANAAP
jgi:hypothetical protein